MSSTKLLRVFALAVFLVPSAVHAQSSDLDSAIRACGDREVGLEAYTDCIRRAGDRYGGGRGHGRSASRSHGRGGSTARVSHSTGPSSAGGVRAEVCRSVAASSVSVMPAGGITSTEEYRNCMSRRAPGARSSAELSRACNVFEEYDAAYRSARERGSSSASAYITSRQRDAFEAILGGYLAGGRVSDAQRGEMERRCADGTLPAVASGDSGSSSGESGGSGSDAGGARYGSGGGH